MSWKAKYLKYLALIPAIYLLILIIQLIPTGLHAKGYLDVINGNYEGLDTQSQADRFATDVERLMKTLNVPVVKQGADLLGLDFSEIAEEVTAVIRTGPTLVGVDSPKKYLISFQNSAEARGTGGILGAYAVVELKQGQFTVLQTGSNASLYGISLKKIPIKMPDEFLKLYGDNPAILQNSNLSPHFPYGAQVWLGLWKEKFNEDLDGVIAVDPSALSYVLKATGEITLKNGEKITSANVVEETLKNAYKKYERDNDARKQYLVDILNATATKLVAGDYSKIEMAKALREAILENRLLLYSTDQKAEKVLAGNRLGGFLELSPNNQFRAVIQNIDASKLDYYLDREVTIKTMSCGTERETQVRVRVTNTLDTGIGLPGYVLTRADKGKPANLVTGAHRFKVFIYGPTNSRLVSVWRENRIANLGGSSIERLRPIYVADVDLAPGESEELLANFTGGIGKISFVDQPLVRQTKISIDDNC
ncbi:MAG: hypothetical protein RL359_24 [Actinomycetota bacterium]|jgi:hypothetical protein